MEYETVAARAARTGEPPHLIRRDAAEGRIPGAVRVGAARSPWALPKPGNENTPAPVGTGVTRTQTAGAARIPDLMSTGDTTDPITTARRVAQRVGLVHTRPAQALADLVFSVAAVAAGHRVDRDGMCSACGWTYPCPDRRALTDALAAADDLTGLGVAS